MRRNMDKSEEVHAPVIPNGEKLWVSYKNVSVKIMYVLTGTPLRDKYILYLVKENGRCKKLGECASPLKLEERFRVLEEISKKK